MVRRKGSLGGWERENLYISQVRVKALWESEED
jgi:hypothetical protein